MALVTQLALTGHSIESLSAAEQAGAAELKHQNAHWFGLWLATTSSQPAAFEAANRCVAQSQRNPFAVSHVMRVDRNEPWAARLWLLKTRPF